MDAKNKKNIDSKEESKNILKTIIITRERLKEEEYKKKDFNSFVKKIKKDININEKSLQKSYYK